MAPTQAGDTSLQDQRQALEAIHTERRIVELKLDPVLGSFDLVHLKEMNRRIFQDLPGLGFADVTPGVLRPAVAGGDWMKERELETIMQPSFVAYSRMDQSALTRLDNALAAADPDRLGRLDTAEFTQAMGKLYAELDYVHPFNDGNSRTLREFTKQLADASGYELDWDRFNASPAGRDVLYVARDLSVNELALPDIRQPGNKRDVLYTLDIYDGSRKLPDLLKDAIEPKLDREKHQERSAPSPTPSRDARRKKDIDFDR